MPAADLASTSLAPHAPSPGGSRPESPRRPWVSAQQLQQWTSSAKPRGVRAAAPGAWVAVGGPAGPRSPAADALGVPPEGCNTLVVYAMEQLLIGRGISGNRLLEPRSALTRFGCALLQQHSITLAKFLDDLRSDDPTQLLAAATLKESIAKGLHLSGSYVRHLDTALDTLSDLPRAQRMLTLDQALLTKMQAPALKTLLPEADKQLLQQVEEFDRGLTATAAGVNQVLLIRLAIALRAKGHGGLTGWLALHNQPEGYRRAKELLEHMLNGPEMALSDVNKRRLNCVAKRLQANELGLATALSARAEAPAQRVSLASGFPHDFPRAEASLIDARLQAGLDGGLSRSTLTQYGRELIRLSEWLRKPTDAGRPALPAGLQTLLDPQCEEAMRQALVGGFTASRPRTNKVQPAVELLLRPPTLSATPQRGSACSLEPEAAPQPPVSTPAAVSPPAPTVPPASAGADAGQALVDASVGGPPSPALSMSSSFDSLFERLGGSDALDTWMQEADDVMSAYPPDAHQPGGPQTPFDLAWLQQRLMADDDTRTFLRGVGDALSRVLPEEPAQTSPTFDTVLGEFAEMLAPALPGTEAPLVKALLPEEAVQWFNSRLQDIQMVLLLPHWQRGEMMGLAQHLTEGDGAQEGLNGFLQRYESSDPMARLAARVELEDYLGPKGRSVLPCGRTDPLVGGLETLAGIASAQRAWTDPARRMTHEQVNSKYKQWLLPPQDRVLLESLTRAQRMQLSRFTRQMLSTGQGGLTNWLVLFNEGQGRLARRLMLDFVKSDPNHKRKGSVALAGARLQAASSTRSGFRLALQGARRTTIGAVARPPAGQAQALLAAGASAPAGPSSRPLAVQQGEAARVNAAPPSAVSSRLSQRPDAPQAGTAQAFAGAPNSSVPRVGIPLEGANTLTAYALAERLALDGKSNSTVMNRRNALESFGEQLLWQMPPMSLARFLAQQASEHDVQRADASARQDAIVRHWPASKRNDALLALRKLGEMPPEQRMWSLEKALHSKMQAAALKKLLPPADQGLLSRVAQLAVGQISGATAGRHQVMLTRFAVGLMAQGCSGLSHWLEMHDDAEGHAAAKELLERFLTDPATASKALRESLLAAIKWLHEVAQMPETEQLHPQLRAPANPEAPVAVRFPADFPPAEAALVDARLAVGKASGLSFRTLENYGRDLVRLSEWLRRPDDPARPARPSGLQWLTTLASAGNEAELLALREAFFGRGKPGNATGALDLLVGLRVGSL